MLQGLLLQHTYLMAEQPQEAGKEADRTVPDSMDKEALCSLLSKSLHQAFVSCPVTYVFLPYD